MVLTLDMGRPGAFVILAFFVFGGWRGSSSFELLPVGSARELLALECPFLFLGVGGFFVKGTSFWCF